MSSCIDIHLSEKDLQDGSEGSELLCELCDRSFKNSNALRMHKVKTHNSVCTESDFRLRHRLPVVQKEAVKRFFCPFADCCRNKEPKYFTAFKLIRQHYMKVHAKKRLSCEMCGVAKFSLQRDLTYHQRRMCLRKDARETKSPIPATRKKESVKSNSQTMKKTHVAPERNQPKKKRNESKVQVTKVLIVTPLNSPQPSKLIPILPRKAVQNASSQTDMDLNKSPHCICKVHWNVESCSKKDASTNVSFSDLSYQPQTLLPPIDSISFQPPQPYEQRDFYCQEENSYANPSATTSQTSEIISPIYNCTITQNDCAVQSNLEYVPETRHVETHMDEFDFEELWRHIETQTSGPFGNDALTQTVNDFMDCGIMTDGPYQPWNYTQTS